MKKLLLVTLCITLLGCLFTGCRRNKDTQTTTEATRNTDHTQNTTQPTTVAPTEAPSVTMPSMTMPDPTETPSTVSPTGGVEDESTARSGRHNSTTGDRNGHGSITGQR